MKGLGIIGLLQVQEYENLLVFILGALENKIPKMKQRSLKLKQNGGYQQN